MAMVEVKCPYCKSTDILKNGKTAKGKQRYYCREAKCKSYFLLEYAYNGAKPNIDEKIINMTANASGIRDISRVLGVSKQKVQDTLKKLKNT